VCFVCVALTVSDVFGVCVVRRPPGAAAQGGEDPAEWASAFGD
jgi:hypothetical protein